MKIATAYMFSNKFLIRAKTKSVYSLHPSLGAVAKILV
jgi:hypothetical protein